MDINVYDSLTIAELIEINPLLINEGDSITLSESVSFYNVFVPLNERFLLPYKEKLAFNTEILQSHNRTEQRIALRQGFPERTFDVKIVLENDYQITRFENKLHRWLKKAWQFPLWQLAEIHTDTITAGDTSISLDTRYSGYRINGFAMIWQDRDTYDIVTISNVTDASISLATTPSNTYTGSKFIMPCLPSKCISAKQRWMYGSSVFDMKFRIKRTVDVTDFIPDMFYDGYYVIGTPSISSSSRINYNYNPDFAVLDEGTSLFEMVSNSDFNIVTQPYNWHCNSKAESWYLRQLFHYINGQQKGMLVPSFRNDLQLSRSVGSGDTTIYVVNSNLTYDLGLNDMRTYIAFRPPSADIIVRRITGINYIDEDEESIDIDQSTGTAFSVNDYISWVDICRLADDNIDFEWYQRGKCLVETNLTRVTGYTEPIVEPYVFSEISVSDEESVVEV